jgi:hypothetical protein
MEAELWMNFYEPLAEGPLGLQQGIHRSNFGEDVVSLFAQFSPLGLKGKLTGFVIAARLQHRTHWSWKNTAAAATK